MNKKELKNLAKKIAKYEKIIQTTEDAKERRNAENEIMKLTSSVKSFDDLMTLDEIIQDILEENS